MPRIILQKDRTKLFNAVVKVKKLQQIGGDSKAIVISQNWIEALNWNSKTHLACALDVLNDQIIIRTSPYKNNEEVEIDEEACVVGTNPDSESDGISEENNA